MYIMAQNFKKIVCTSSDIQTNLIILFGPIKINFLFNVFLKSGGFSRSKLDFLTLIFLIYFQNGLEISAVIVRLSTMIKK